MTYAEWSCYSISAGAELCSFVGDMGKIFQISCIQINIDAIKMSSRATFCWAALRQNNFCSALLCRVRREVYIYEVGNCWCADSRKH